MKNRIITLADARDERVAIDAQMQIRERAQNVRYLRANHRIAVKHGWTCIAARYEARIARMVQA